MAGGPLLPKKKDEGDPSNKSVGKRFGKQLKRVAGFGDKGKGESVQELPAKVWPVKQTGRFTMPLPVPTPAIVLLKEGMAPPAKESVGGGRFMVQSPEEEVELEPLSIAVAGYETRPSLISLNLQLLGSRYLSCRQICGDGNSFYRAFMFAYLEHILESEDVAEIARFKEKIDQLKQLIIDFERAHECIFMTIDEIVSMLESMIVEGTGKSRSHVHDLRQMVNAPGVSERLVEFLRVVTATEILKKRSDFFQPLLGNGEEDSLEFCRTRVLSMGVEGGDYQIMALCSAVGVPIRVYYLDQSSIANDRPIASRIYSSLPLPNADHANPSQVPNESGDIEPLLEFASWPGHYGILYR